jgi:glycosyltransferase involved in cell wall biosynthesis
MKRKIVVISVKKPSNFGGAEIVWQNLKKKGFDFENISLENNDLPKIYKKIPLAFHLKEIFASKELIKKALNKKPDVLIYDKIFGWPKTNSKVKKICYNHGSYTLAGLTFKKKNIFVYLFYKYILSYFEKKSYENADKIIAVSKSVKDEMINYFKINENKICVIDNAVDLKNFRPQNDKKRLREKYNLPLNKKILFFPGRASFGKGFDIAKKVLGKLGKEYFLLVLGEGKSKVENINFIGKIPNEKMSEIYNCADITFFPSRYEGSSVSVLESAACGTPLILSGVGLMKTNSTMKYFICDNIEEYIKKIKNIDIKSASKKWLNFSKNYSIDKQAKELNKLLKNEK